MIRSAILACLLVVGCTRPWTDLARSTAIVDVKGSGTVVGIQPMPDGQDRILILTAAHVVAGRWRVPIAIFRCGSHGLPVADRWFMATVIYRDEFNDLAVLQASVDSGFCRASDVTNYLPRTGMEVWTVGFPKGAYLISRGVVTGWLFGDPATDAMVAPGSSGGGVYNARRELIGVMHSHLPGEPGFGRFKLVTRAMVEGYLRGP